MGKMGDSDETELRFFLECDIIFKRKINEGKFITEKVKKTKRYE